MQCYRFSPLPSSPAVGGAPPYANGVNAAGQAVGAIGDSPAMWDADLNVTMLTYGVTSGVANAINATGSIAGTSYRYDESRAIACHEGRTIDIGGRMGFPLPGHPPVRIQSDGLAINDLGLVAGTIGWAGQKVPFLHDLATGELTVLESLPGHDETAPIALNNLGHMVGWSRKGNDSHAFLWRDGQFLDLGTELALEDINDYDIVVGRRRDPVRVWVPCFADASGATAPPIQDLPVRADSATAINNSGTIIGGSIAGTIPLDVFVHFPPGHPEAGTRLLEGRVFDADGWSIYAVTDISDTGVITGSAVGNLGQGFILHPFDGP
jgi:probable HAF family extracellular repeat protein